MKMNPEKFKKMITNTQPMVGHFSTPTSSNNELEEMFKNSKPKAIVEECPRCGGGGIKFNMPFEEYFGARRGKWECLDCDLEFRSDEYEELKESDLTMTPEDEIDCMVNRTERLRQERQFKFVSNQFFKSPKIPKKYMKNSYSFSI